jgi:hypothetical protein
MFYYNTHYAGYPYKRKKYRTELRKYSLLSILACAVAQKNLLTIGTQLAYLLFYESCLYLRFNDPRRGKGKRGGLRIIYYWWDKGPEFWLFTLYDKNEASDLSADERKIIGKHVKEEISARRKLK